MVCHYVVCDIMWCVSFQKLEEDLRKKHQEEISASALAHSAALNAAQKSAEVNVKMHLTNSRTLLQAQHGKSMDVL